MTETPKLAKRNALLREVSKHILAEPAALGMDVWIRRVDSKIPWAPTCGTVACIAGWTCLFGAKLSASYLEELSGLGVFNMARKLLNLSTEKAYGLFLASDWPGRFRMRYLRLEEAQAGFPEKERLQALAELTVARINHFIKTSE